MVLGVVTPVYDYLKENLWFFFGPTEIFRFFAIAFASALAIAVSHPFDTIRTRMHTMRPLPNGEMPFINSFDCLFKMYRYESQIRYSSNLSGIYAGSYAAFARLLVIAYTSVRVLDYYFDSTPH